MTTTREAPPTTTPPPPPSYDAGRGPITRAAPWAAGLWAVLYAAMAVLHLVRDTVAPWAPNPASVIGSFSEGEGAALVMVLGLAGGGALGAALTAPQARAGRVAAWVLAATGLVVALVVGDTRTLAFVGYLPMLLLGTVGIGPATDLDPGILGGSMLSLGCSVGGLAMVVVAAGTLGRGPIGRAWWSASSVARAGRWAVGVAVAVPAFYALTRVAWAAGIPLGVREEMLTELGDARWAGLGLALFALVGCVLTLGLVQRWGEVFWSWVPVLGGRPVPVAMAVVPALFVAAIVTSAGLGFWRMVLTGELEEMPGAREDWAAWAPELLWPLWGVALAAAALAHRARRTVTR